VWALDAGFISTSMIPRLALRRAPEAARHARLHHAPREEKKKENRGRRTRDCGPMVIYTVLKEASLSQATLRLVVEGLSTKGDPGKVSPPSPAPRPHVFSTRQVPTSPVSCTFLGPVLPSVDKTLLGVSVEPKLFDMGVFSLSKKDPGAFKCCLSASWSAPTAKPSRELTSNPNLLSPPKLFSSFPLRQEAAGAVVKPLVWALISTSHRGHSVTKPVYPHHFLDSDPKIRHHHRRGHPFGRQIRELVAHFTCEGQKAAEELGPCSAHSHSKALWPPSAVRQSAGTSDQ